MLLKRVKNDPYHVPGQKRAQLVKEYLLSDRRSEPAILLTGVMKPEFYIHKRFLFFFIFDQVLNGEETAQPVSPLPMIVLSEFCNWNWAINQRFTKELKSSKYD